MNSPQFCRSERRGRPVQQGLRRHNPSQVELQPLSQRGTRVFIGSHVSTSHIRLSANDVWRRRGGRVWHRFKSTPPPPPPLAQHVTLPPRKQNTFHTLPPVERIPICPAAKFQTGSLGEFEHQALVILPPLPLSLVNVSRVCGGKIRQMMEGVERLSLSVIWIVT